MRRDALALRFSLGNTIRGNACTINSGPRIHKQLEREAAIF